MAYSFGALNASLTSAVKRIAVGSSSAIGFRRHALERMDQRGFDHAEVLTCLRKGKVYGPEIEEGELRANVIHGGLHIRVVVAGLDEAQSDWSDLTAISVVTVIPLDK